MIDTFKHLHIYINMGKNMFTQTNKQTLLSIETRKYLGNIIYLFLSMML